MLDLCPRYISELANKDIEVLSAKEEKDLAKKISKGCKKSLELLVQHNLRLVIKTAHKYKGCGVDFMDLINEGNIGLFFAAKRFKASKGVRFSTYAGYWIRQKMIRYVNNNGRTIRLPCHVYKDFSELKKEVQNFHQTYGTIPSISYLAKKLSLTKRKVKTLMPHVDPHVCLDAQIGEDTSQTTEQLIPSIENDANKAIMEKEKIAILRSALKILTKREKYIIERRFGLHGDKKETLETIGKKYKITRERIRQIESDALFKLKNILEENRIEL